MSKDTLQFDIREVNFSSGKMFKMGFWAGAGFIVAKVTLTAIATKMALASAKKAVKNTGDKFGDQFVDAFKESIAKKMYDWDNKTKDEIIEFMESTKKKESEEEK